jgi:tRNA modification GTPase
MYVADTIVAPATAPGRGAVAIVRLSGPRAIEILHRIWRPLHPHELRPRELALGDVFDPATGADLDRAFAVTMRAPHSLTGEEVVELQCHGGPYLVRRILDVAVAHGARPAEPGEFSRRAFLNGRMDLTEAEAVADLVEARSESALGQARAQLAGALAEKIGQLRGKITAIRAHLEAEIDFSDEDIRLPSRREMAGELERVMGDVALLHESFARGRVLREGARIAIIGKPNVGKSSVLNLLLGTDRAIVTPVPGTTRDVLEESIQVGPYALVVSDTAGLRDSADAVERIGIDRAHRSLAEADLVLAVFDSSRPFEREDSDVVRLCRGRAGVALLNKRDLAPVFGATTLREAELAIPILEFSALTADGLPALREELARAVEALAGASAGAGVVISRERHRDALARALGALRTARASALELMPPEIVAVDVTAASDALGAITGEVTSEDVLDAIFREFCIGK